MRPHDRNLRATRGSPSRSHWPRLCGTAAGGGIRPPPAGGRFDINSARIEALKSGHDATREVEPTELASNEYLHLRNQAADIRDCNTCIVTVPTPTDTNKHPDLTPLIKASEILGRVLKRGDVIIYESTVDPGATEEDCVPILEHVSGLPFNKDFFIGCSRERINPGDKQHRLRDTRNAMNTKQSQPRLR